MKASPNQVGKFWVKNIHFHQNTKTKSKVPKSARTTKHNRSTADVVFSFLHMPQFISHLKKIWLTYEMLHEASYLSHYTAPHTPQDTVYF